MEDKRLAAIGPNPSGLCMCGCRRKTKIVTKSDRRHGHVMGQPFRFIHGHSRPAAKGPNRFKLRRRTAVIFLERRDGTVLECLVSRKDFHRVRRHHWYANKNGSGRPTRLHGLTVIDARISVEFEEPPDRDRKQHPTPITSRAVSLGLVPTEVRAGFGYPQRFG